MRTLNFVSILILILLFSCTKEAKYTQPELGNRSVEIITVEGYQFKDLNKNGQLDRYEDWGEWAQKYKKEMVDDMIMKVAAVEEGKDFYVASKNEKKRGD